jgi:ABC-type sugar transport system substrate-binding protein
MANRTTTALASIIEKLTRTKDMVQPVIVMGDEGSIYLTERQEGFKEGLEAAIRIIEQTST